MITPDSLALPTVADAVRLLARSEFRDCAAWQERAVLLHARYGVAPAVICAALHVSRSSVFAAIKKARDGVPFRCIGRPSLLSDAGKLELTNEILERECNKDAAYPAEVAAMAARIIEKESKQRDSNFISSPMVSRQWAHSFINSPRSGLHTGQRRSIEPARADVSLQDLNRYFDLLKNLMDNSDYPPELIANFDETMLKVTDKGKRSVIQKDARVGYVKIDEQVLHFTMGVTIFADGTYMKPFVILPLRTMPTDIAVDVLKTFNWAGQDSGWVTREIFASYADFFIAEVKKRRRAGEYPPDRKALLICDGHSSRACPITLRKFRDNKIDVLIPVAHSTHLVQPLDVHFFSIFKSRMSGFSALCAAKTVPERRAALLNKTISAFHSAANYLVITDSFKRSGVWPLDPSIPLSSDSAPKEDSPRPVDAKKKRSGVNINCRMAAGEDVCRMLDEANAKREKRNSKKTSPARRGRPKKAQHQEAGPKNEVEE